MPKVEVVPSGVHAIMAVDPGGTTGVAAGYVELRSTMKETLAGMTMRKALEVEGDWLDQAKQLADLMGRFQFAANSERSMSLGAIHYVFEDFVLRMPATTTNLTSIWVAAGAVALSRTGQDVHWQQASQAKSYANDERLRRWGLWERGSAHKRDAWRHFVLFANTLLR